MANPNNNRSGMTHVRVWVADFVANQPATLEVAVGLEAPDFMQACIYLGNAGLFANQDGENVWYPPRSIVKIIEEKKGLVSC